MNLKQAVEAFGIAAIVLSQCLSTTDAAISASRQPQIASERAHPAHSRTAPPGWFFTKRINDHTYMISMPRYFQKNVAYLIVGNTRAILFDTGPGIYSITSTVRQITALPLLAIPSHLHYDHVGNLADFEDIGVLDASELRSINRTGAIHLTPHQLMLREPYSAPFRPFRVTRWLTDNTTIDLGGITIRVLSTPGHTPDSVTLVDEAAGNVFSGDLVGERDVWALTRGARLSQIASSLRNIMSRTAASRIFEAHSEIPLTRHSLARVASEIDKNEAGGVSAFKTCFDGQNMVTYRIGDTSYVTGDLPPLETNNSPFRIEDHPCRNGR